MVEQKKCSHCNKTFPLTDFHSWATRQGLKYGKWCQNCYVAINAKRIKRPGRPIDGPK
jgi:hypothetical protein